MITENSLVGKARLAGIIYLILIASGVLNYMVIPKQYLVWDDPIATVENIRQAELLFRWGIMAGIITFLSYLVLPLALYRLLKHIDKMQAQLMVIFAVVSVPISLTNLLHKFDILTLLGGSSYLAGLDPSELQFQVMFHLDAFYNGVSLVQIFWGLWLFPFGWLVYRSGFLPRLLGILLMAGCFSHIIAFVGPFFFENYNSGLLATLVGLPATIGEFGICLWLLFAPMGKSNTA